MQNYEQIKTQLQDLKKIYNTFGEEHQLKKLGEEAAEFLHSYLKGDIYNARAEIADLKVLVDQFYLEEPTIRQEYQNKIKRTIERIESKHYEV